MAENLGPSKLFVGDGAIREDALGPGRARCIRTRCTIQQPGLDISPFHPWNVLTGLRQMGQVWWDAPGMHPGSDALALMARGAW